MQIRFYSIILLILCFSATSWSQNIWNNPMSNHGNKFEQLGTILPTPNVYRSASGAPGHKYWQQKADYVIDCELDEVNRRLEGQETITYYNNSPDELTYLWIQLDENEHNSSKYSGFDKSSKFDSGMSTTALAHLKTRNKDEKFGLNIISVSDEANSALPYVINRTMMRIDLPKTLMPGAKTVIKIVWDYNIPDRVVMWGRGGYEYFDEDGNIIFTMSQWYPRLCVYSDFQGWQNHQFTGRGEFALTFGDFDVSMTVPADHAVASTGECSNYGDVLTKTQLKRLKRARNASAPIEIITLEEAKEKEKRKSTQKKTWKFFAKNVRDFAWTASRKFVWDAMYTSVEGKSDDDVLCMSLYPKEAYSLYSKYSTKVVAHTVRTYSHFSTPYPYPVAQSIEASSGMEYPMICFNYGRTEKDGTYSESIKYGMISVIIHEVGHNFFPMIVNSDERQWSWFDEGLNTFLQFLTEQLWQNDYPSRRGPAYQIVDYMSISPDQLEPIMTNSENIIHFGPNAYGKPATALNILRETVMGRELFDYAFKEYSRRWAFRHPEPADFFRTMEDASAVDLDWFWRGWFYDIQPVDIALDSVKVLTFDPTSIQIKDQTRTTYSQIPYEHLSRKRNRKDSNIKFAVEQDPSLLDFYNTYRPWETKESAQTITRKDNREPISKTEQEEITKGKYFYQLYMSNLGGLVSPIIIEWTYDDDSKEKETIDAQIWRYNEYNVEHAVVKTKRVKSIRLDPNRETADINEINQSWPEIAPTKHSRFQLYKRNKKIRGAAAGNPNPMQQAKKKK